MQNNSFGKNIIRGLRKRVNKWFKNPYKEVNLNKAKLIYLKHLSPGVMRSHLLNGKPVYFNIATEFVAGIKEIFIDKIYEQQLSQHPYIIDCGANIGLSVIFVKERYPDAEIVAFEPDPMNFELLTKNIQARNYSNVVLRNEAVWIENTQISFSSRGSTDSRIDPSGNNSTLVPAVRLKELLVKKVEFLKMDIEGAEYQVLKDISENLNQVNNLFIEYHGSFSENEEFAEIIQILTRQGFHYYIKEAASVYKHPFFRSDEKKPLFDIQLNIFCFRFK